MVATPIQPVSDRPLTTDLVRQYLQEIGRVPLLTPSQELRLAQQVQQYQALLAVRDQSDDPQIKRYVAAVTERDRQQRQLGRPLTRTQWAARLKMSVAELQTCVQAGRQAWAKAANMTLSELQHIERQGQRAKTQLLQANLRLVVNIAKKYQHRGVEFLDLIQEGSLGLERAVEKFDPTKGFRFSTYAYWWIRQSVTRAVASQSRTIRLPIHMVEKLNKIKRAQRRLAAQQGAMPSLADIAQELNLEVSQVREVLMAVPKSVALEQRVGSDQETELQELIESTAPTPNEVIMRESLRTTLKQLLSDLSPRERQVMELRYGLGEQLALEMAEIAALLGLSRERIRQIEHRALQKLRQPQRRREIQDYLEEFA
ncbi:RNA polymerase sigma factor, RpoD/SigA family [Thermosynechococcus sp. QS41]|uniref:RNA polymerase sigma factor, RpoD/SigA family n=1 Tax=Thermosynechococcus sp. QS41 TaxID=3074101 RepID=UPI00287789C2|nr:RNA polymerase sigma factor, RpoD/SigA family [Thermosynechococcus sp. QS41]WNC59715.1 RNA polymerase sigma factor, RpoD/SigA family [Thermosynechococcus sp. QS41]